MQNHKDGTTNTVVSCLLSAHLMDLQVKNNKQCNNINISKIVKTRLINLVFAKIIL